MLVATGQDLGFNPSIKGRKEFGAGSLAVTLDQLADGGRFYIINFVVSGHGPPYLPDPVAQGNKKGRGKSPDPLSITPSRLHRRDNRRLIRAGAEGEGSVALLLLEGGGHADGLADEGCPDIVRSLTDGIATDDLGGDGEPNLCT